MNGSHTWMSHGTHRNESCHTYEWLARMDEPHVYGWVMLHVWTSDVTYMNSHVTRMNESYDAKKDLHHFLFQITVHGSALRHVHRVHRQVMQAEHLNNVYVCVSVWVCLCVFINISICTRIYMHTYLVHTYRARPPCASPSNAGRTPL